MIPKKELDEITEELEKLKGKINSYTARGCYDINKVCEDFFIPILQRTHDCPQLYNLNIEQENFPGVDLGDLSNRTCIQVTTTKSTPKANKTIEFFLKHKLESRFNKLYIFILGERQKQYALKGIDELGQRGVEFSVNNIFGFKELLLKIQTCSVEDIAIIHKIICTASSVLSNVEELKENLPRILELAAAKVGREAADSRYLPEVYLEPGSTKEEARFFSSPSLMYSKNQFYLRALPLDRLDYLLDLNGKQAISPQLELPTFDSLNSVREDRKAVQKALDTVYEYDFYQNKREIDPDDEYHLYNSKVALGGAAAACRFTLEETMRRIDLVEHNVLFITDEAGTGKTNFLCDFILHFLLPNHIPTFFFTSQDVYFHGGGCFSNLFKTDVVLGPICSDKDFLTTLSHWAHENNQSIVIVIDGLNEAKKLLEFSYQFRNFLTQLSDYSGIKLLVSCRSELFEERFKWVKLNEFSNSISISNRLFSHDNKKVSDRMLKGYFSHFKIDAVLGPIARRQLTSPLLLRIFCEVYRGKSEIRFSSIYRHELFVTYVKKKFDGLGSSASKEHKVDAIQFLDSIALQMVRLNQYANISLDLVKGLDGNIADCVISEGFVLRQDGEIVDDFGDIFQCISFSFDQLRDFFIARVLLKSAVQGEINWEEISRRNFSEDSPIIEGVGYFLFVMLRKKQLSGLYDDLVCFKWFTIGWFKGVFELEDRFLTENDECMMFKHVQTAQNLRECIFKLFTRWCIERREKLAFSLLRKVVVEIPAIEMHEKEKQDSLKYVRESCYHFLEKKKYPRPEDKDKLKEIIKLAKMG